MVQNWFLSNGSYSLKNCNNPFGKAIQPPLTAKFRLNTENPYMGLPLLFYCLLFKQVCTVCANLYPAFQADRAASGHVLHLQIDHMEIHS